MFKRLYIPNVIQELGILQEGCADFFPGASDHCACTRRKQRRKIGRKADAAKNQLLNHVRYIILFACHINLCAEQVFYDKNQIFKDLELVKIINRELKDELPFFYNYSMMGGYFAMPSARMPKTGVIAAGFANVPPYQIYGVNFQPFDRIELSANYRIYKGITEYNFGNEGFGDDADRIGNVKLGVLMPQDGYPFLPSISIGLEDFLGTKRFNSQYVVMTKQFLNWDIEFTLGWGHQRIKGFFGGIVWTPLEIKRSYF